MMTQDEFDAYQRKVKAEFERWTFQPPPPVVPAKRRAVKHPGLWLDLLPIIVPFIVVLGVIVTDKGVAWWLESGGKADSVNGESSTSTISTTAAKAGDNVLIGGDDIDSSRIYASKIDASRLHADTITDKGIARWLKSNSKADADLEKTYEFHLGSAPGFAWRIRTGRLPPGLTLSDGVISGTPTHAGRYCFALEGGDGVDSSTTASYCIDVKR